MKKNNKAHLHHIFLSHNIPNREAIHIVNNTKPVAITNPPAYGAPTKLFPPTGLIKTRPDQFNIGVNWINPNIAVQRGKLRQINNIIKSNDLDLYLDLTAL